MLIFHSYLKYSLIIKGTVWFFTLLCLKLLSHRRRCSPCHDDEEVQSIPRVPQVTSAAKDSQGHHLYNHLQSEENVDERIKSLKDTQRYWYKCWRATLHSERLNK